MQGLGKDINGEILAKYALDSSAATAGGAGDNTEVNGATLDTQGLAAKAHSVSFIIGAKATLTADKTLVVTAKIEDSADGSSWADLVASATILTLTATGVGQAKLGVDLGKARRYVRVSATPNLSHTATDTSTIFGIAVFGGMQELPQ